MRTRTELPDLPARHARTILPGPVHARLRHVALDLGLTVGEVLVEAAVLICRYHGLGTGLPEPTPPKKAVSR